MTSYEYDIRSVKHLRMEDILRIAGKHVPGHLTSCPWTHYELDHGKGILKSEEALNCYLAAYGIMHANKMFWMLKNSIKASFDTDFEVVDWGCGQGLAALCLVEFLQEHKFTMPSRITLVDASAAALRRAKLHLEVMTGSTVELHSVERVLIGSVNRHFWKDDAVYATRPFVLHLLSNIFDMPGISLHALSRCIKSAGRDGLVLCAAHYSEKTVNAISMFSSSFSSVSTDTLFTSFGDHLWKRSSGYTYGAALKAFRIRQPDTPTTAMIEQEEEFSAAA